MTGAPTRLPRTPVTGVEIHGSAKPVAVGGPCRLADAAPRGGDQGMVRRKSEEGLFDLTYGLLVVASPWGGVRKNVRL